MNNKLLSIMAITAMCLVSCAVLVDFDESDAAKGDVAGGFTDLGTLNFNVDYGADGSESDPTHVYTGIADVPFGDMPEGFEAYIALNARFEIHSQWYDFSRTTFPGVDFEISNGFHDYDYASDHSTDCKAIVGVFDSVGTFVLTCYDEGDDYPIVMTFHVVDTPFDAGKPMFLDLGDFGLTGYMGNYSTPYSVFTACNAEDLFWDMSVAEYYFAVGSEFNYESYRDILSVSSGYGLSISGGDTLVGTISKAGDIKVVTENGSFTIHAIDTNQKVAVSSITVSGTDTLSVGGQVTLTATTNPADATERGVEWSIVSGDGFVSRVSTTDTSTGGTITLKGVSDGVATIRATAADGSGVYKDFQVTVSTPQIDIESIQDDVSLTTAMSFLYTVQTNVTDCQVLVSGASWLSVNGNTISGTPTSTGEYDITVTVTKAGYLTATQTFTINVISSLGWLNEPSAGAIVYEI